MTLPRRTATLVAACLILAGCASTAPEDAERLAQAGNYEGALHELDSATRRDPANAELSTALGRQRERVLAQLASKAELALAAGRLDEAAQLIQRSTALDPRQPRLADLSRAFEQARRPAALPNREAAAPLPPPTMGPAFQKAVTLEFREAPLRQVFESLARSSGVNFVFDKDVRGDTRITVSLRGVTLDEAMRVMLATQQLDRKLLNEQTVLVYPNTAIKQREHQELVTRSIYLVNADPKQALTLVRTMAKTRDIVVDERINALVVRDTPEVVRQVEQLVAAIDMAEPEVMLAVEVLEVASDRLDELGLGWPANIGFGIPGVATVVETGAAGYRGLVANPALTAALRGTAGTTNLLANPTIRARNREKAKVQIGEKLPVFTTTAVANAGVSASVSYIDVGLKLDVEPSVQLDGEVVIKVALEVSNLLREVNGPAGSASKAYEVGTRMISTSLRLRDGQTQVLAGLINDQDRQSSTGLPGLSRLPLLGRLFGVHRDERSKTEIVMMITPRVVRNLALPDPAVALIRSGTDSQPGAETLRLRSAARAVVGVGRGAPAVSSPQGGAAAPVEAVQLNAAQTARVGQTWTVTLANRAGRSVTGELGWDPSLLQPANAAPAGATPGRWPFALDGQAETVLVLRVLPAAAGQRLAVQATADAPVEGEATVQVPGP